MTSRGNLATSDCCLKRKMNENITKMQQSSSIEHALQTFVSVHESFRSSGKMFDLSKLAVVPECMRNFFVFYIKQVNAISDLYDCLDHLLENNKSSFSNSKIVDLVHEVSSSSINSLKNLTSSIVEELSNSYKSPSPLLPLVPEPSVKLRRVDSSKTPKDDTKSSFEDDVKPPFEDDDIDLGGSDIDLQLDEIVDKDIESKSVDTQSQSLLNGVKGYPLKQNEQSSFESFGRGGDWRCPNTEYSNRKQKYDDARGSGCDSDNKGRRNFNYDSDGFAKVYIDGACLSNGKANAQAGIGVWFGDDNPLNISAPVRGSPTNNNAEIQAATQAILKAASGGVRKLRLYTDSQFLINCMTKWIFTWKRNNWMNSSNKPVINKVSLMELDKVIPLLDDINWKYVAGHTGIIGNERADTLAKQGARKML